jgi:hypothetical protein
VGQAWSLWVRGKHHMMETLDGGQDGGDRREGTDLAAVAPGRCHGASADLQEFTWQPPGGRRELGSGCPGDNCGEAFAGLLGGPADQVQYVSPGRQDRTAGRRDSTVTVRASERSGG